MPPNTGGASGARQNSKSVNPRPAAPSTTTSQASSRASSRASSPTQTTRGRPVRPRPSPQGSGSAQLLRKISVAGVTVEVVRQNSTIIYRLPGNMPVSSLSAEQRSKVMSEIQRLRNSNAAATGSGPGIRPIAPQRNLRSAGGAAQHSRPRPSLPTLAPRSILSSESLAGPRSAPVAGSLSAPSTPPNGLSRMAQTPGAKRSQLGVSSSPGATPKSALEKMYQSAYLRLLSGPAEVLRKLNPPVEISTIIKEDVSADSTAAPTMLLQILKALTKSQASQLAHMYDAQARAKAPGELSIDMYSTASSQPQSGEVSPASSYMSGTERDMSDLLHSGTATPTPTKRRKYNKTGKYSVKNRTWTLDSARESIAGIRSPSAGAYTRADISGIRSPGIMDKPKVPLTKHEAEVARRFRQALAMDHRMVANTDWQTPFADTRDAIQRLLPFHIFQQPDSSIDHGIAHEEEQISSNMPSLEKRAGALMQRYDKMLERQGTDEHYATDFIQLDRLRISDLSEELEQLDDARMQRDISTVGNGLFW
ncbi:hypothetical protein BX667DRAFT_493281 [Coemansia mojavensis]|nr:hypothetical protein BX667DRAFT_493281 [Coemansia mojavensis]